MLKDEPCITYSISKVRDETQRHSRARQRPLAKHKGQARPAQRPTQVISKRETNRRASSEKKNTRTHGHSTSQRGRRNFKGREGRWQRLVKPHGREVCALAPATFADTGVYGVVLIGLVVHRGDGEVPHAHTLGRCGEQRYAKVCPLVTAITVSCRHTLAAHHEPGANVTVRVRNVAVHMATDKLEHPALIEQLASGHLPRNLKQARRCRLVCGSISRMVPMAHDDCDAQARLLGQPSTRLGKQRAELLKGMSATECDQPDISHLRVGKEVGHIGRSATEQMVMALRWVDREVERRQTGTGRNVTSGRRIHGIPV